MGKGLLAGSGRRSSLCRPKVLPGGPSSAKIHLNTRIDLSGCMLTTREKVCWTGIRSQALCREPRRSRSTRAQVSATRAARQTRAARAACSSSTRRTPSSSPRRSPPRIPTFSKTTRSPPPRATACAFSTSRRATAAATAPRHPARASPRLPAPRAPGVPRSPETGTGALGGVLVSARATGGRQPGPGARGRACRAPPPPARRPCVRPARAGSAAGAVWHARRAWCAPASAGGGAQGAGGAGGPARVPGGAAAPTGAARGGGAIVPVDRAVRLRPRLQRPSRGVGLHRPARGVDGRQGPCWAAVPAPRAGLRARCAHPHRGQRPRHRRARGLPTLAPPRRRRRPRSARNPRRRSLPRPPRASRARPAA
jgi:hypothetical protein